jgi:diguanylate cyclase (GGDEF)-like protein
MKLTPIHYRSFKLGRSGRFHYAMLLAQHSHAFATANALTACAVEETAITAGLLERLVACQKLRAWMLPMPLGMITYLSRDIPNHRTVWLLVGGVCLSQAFELFMAIRISRAWRNGGRSNVLMAGWLFIAMLTALAWGALMWPISDSLNTGIESVFDCIALVVTIAIGALMMAHLKRALYAYLVGANLAMLPLALFLIPRLGALPIIALSLLMSSIVLVAGTLTRQAHDGLVAELKNAQMASDLKTALSAAEFLSQRDSLTGLLNRRAFEEAAAELGQSETQPTTLILLDLDHFKKVNDSFGHAVGDDVLRSTARLITNFAQPDVLGTVPAEATARWGGEEFIIALGDCSLPTAMVAAEQLRARLAEYRAAHWPELLSVTGSFGVTEWRPGELLHEAIGRADKAMYQAKVAGRNLVMSIATDDSVVIDSYAG